ncbi:MAG TPA: hydantoinase B/oxoprolinase family protein [Solirubrobacterales bacterium]|nr:hydantoinase B/oxoprolinase family protein [Solirubrobacterales bacterium]
MTSTIESTWDGKDYPYKPAADFTPPEGLKLHTELAQEELDPITFEVLSTKLWNINEEHADTIHRVSGSPVVVENYDFNTSITTETGEPFLFAPYVQYFGGAAEFTVKYTLENRTKSPGINPGDVFIINDCLIAGSHQMDVGIYAPVFVGDELFCWVYNACHARDVGGIEAGSFCFQAEDIFWDPPMLRAVKIADRDGIRADVEDTFLRFSRIPHLLALELRSQLAGVGRARMRIEELLQAYSPAIVKSTMHKLIDDTERAVSERLLSVPDGRWSDVVYCGGAFPGDRGVHKTVLSLEKRGDELFFDNHGTDPQIAAFNCGFGQWRSAIGCSLTHTLAHDHKLCAAGVMRRSHFDAEIGTITTVDRNGAFSTLHAQILSIFQAEKVIGKMLYPDPGQRQHLMATSVLSALSLIAHHGTDQWGGPFASVTLDHTAGGLGAFATRDGIDQGGTTFWPKSEIPDCETTEQYAPVLYLYRRSARNCGHGKYRGGNGIAFALAGHGTDDQHYSALSVTSSTPTCSGVSGGHPGVLGLFYSVEDSDVLDRFADGEIPCSPEDIRDLGGRARALPAKTGGLRLLATDVSEQILCGGGGYGDPLERDPHSVAVDLAAGEISARTASEIYGVVLDADGAPEPGATDALRAELRSQRIRRSTLPPPFPGKDDARTPIIEIADQLRVERMGEDLVTCCRRCSTALGPAQDNYKDHAARYDGQLTEIDATLFVDPSEELDVDLVYRSYCCPNCGVLFDNELTLREDPPVWDVRVDVTQVGR